MPETDAITAVIGPSDRAARRDEIIRRVCATWLEAADHQS
jgi:hypothetical protein